MAIAALRKYKSAIDRHPSIIESAEIKTERFLLTIEEHIKVLTATCETLNVLIVIDENTALTKMGEIATDMQTCWAELNEIVEIFSGGVKEEMMRAQQNMNNPKNTIIDVKPVNVPPKGSKGPA